MSTLNTNSGSFCGQMCLLTIGLLMILVIGLPLHLHNQPCDDGVIHDIDCFNSEEHGLSDNSVVFLKNCPFQSDVTTTFTCVQQRAHKGKCLSYDFENTLNDLFSRRNSESTQPHTRISEQTKTPQRSLKKLLESSRSKPSRSNNEGGSPRRLKHRHNPHRHSPHRHTPPLTKSSHRFSNESVGSFTVDPSFVPQFTKSIDDWEGKPKDHICCSDTNFDFTQSRESKIDTRISLFARVKKNVLTAKDMDDDCLRIEEGDVTKEDLGFRDGGIITMCIGGAFAAGAIIWLTVDFFKKTGSFYETNTGETHDYVKNRLVAMPVYGGYSLTAPIIRTFRRRSMNT